MTVSHSVEHALDQLVAFDWLSFKVCMAIADIRRIGEVEVHCLAGVKVVREMPQPSTLLVTKLGA